MKKIITSASFIFSVLFSLSQSGTQTFTVSGTFTVQTGVTSLDIEVVGAGGDGGGNGGGGGGGGGYAKGTYSVTPHQVLIVTVGTGGGGASSGTSSVGSLISATGGGNGTSVSNPNIGGGGAGGVGTNGTTINNTGGTGGGGYWTYFGGGGAGAAGPTSNGASGGNAILWTGVCQTPGGSGGLSGGTPGGDGGKGAGFTDPGCNVTNPAVAGLSYGGGGGGGNGNGGPTATGSGGFVQISYGTTNVNAIASKNNVSVFPNPFTNRISLQNASGKENYELVNSIGEIIWNGKQIEQKDFSDLKSGIYFLKITDEKGFVSVIKTVKQ
ncbi:MAG: T9SS type A sorting domain-containing protein [Bacteroidia bacterium]|nr:T9SS type A sorting domain-containing protein [Bacteroidia bacterium]